VPEEAEPAECARERAVGAVPAACVPGPALPVAAEPADPVAAANAPAGNRIAPVLVWLGGYK